MGWSLHWVALGSGLRVSPAFSRCVGIKFSLECKTQTEPSWSFMYYHHSTVVRTYVYTPHRTCLIPSNILTLLLVEFISIIVSIKSWPFVCVFSCSVQFCFVLIFLKKCTNSIWLHSSLCSLLTVINFNNFNNSRSGNPEFPAVKREIIFSCSSTHEEHPQLAVCYN